MDKTLQKKRDRFRVKLTDGFRSVRGLVSGALLCSLLSVVVLTGLSCSEKAHDPGLQEETALLLERDRESVVPLPSTKEFAEEALIVYTGILVDKVYELSLVSRTFSADGYIWLEWPSSVQELMERNGIGPRDIVRLANRVEIWDSLFEPVTAEPRLLSGGRYYQRYRFSSRFYDDEIEFRRDPFGEVNLPVIIEVAAPSMSDKYAEVLLLPHHQANGFMGRSGSLSGYRLNSSSFEPHLHRYSSRFGSWYHPTFSQMRLEMVYQADYWSAFVNWVFPLMIIMAVVLLSPSVAGSLGDVRLAIPSTALLTLIFLQQSYHDELPPLPYLTFLDELFAVGYAIALGLFGLFTWGTNTYAQAEDKDKTAVAQRIDRVDLVFQLISVAIFVAVGVGAWVRN
jgi:hypothetical protein